MRTSRRAVTAAIALLAIASWGRFASAQPADSYDVAARELERDDAQRAQQVLAWLGSHNPYLRQAALLRLHERSVAVTDAAFQPLLDQLDDDAVRPIGTCVQYLAGPEPMGEGAIEVRGQCRAGMRSNASIALEILTRQPWQNAQLCAAIVATIARNPRHGDELAPTSRACPTTGLLAAIASTTAEPARQALLHRLLASGQSLDDRDVPAITTLLQSPNDRTRGLGALVLLETARQRQAVALSRPLALPDLSVPVAEIERCIGNDTCGAVLDDLALVGDAAAPWASALVRRLGRPQAVRPLVTLRIIAGLHPVPAAAFTQIAKLLAGDGVDEVLRALATLDEADARRIRPAVLQAAARKHDRYYVADLSLALAVVAAGRTGVAPAEFAALDRAYRASCERPERSYHDQPDASWCEPAKAVMIDLALSGGYRFAR